MMATLRCDHPDIEAFVDAKRDPRRLRMFNVSVLVTDAFMQAVKDDAGWDLVFAGKVYRTVGARGLSCTSSAQCPGAAAGWEACQDTNGDGIADTCVITVDPTPGASIDFSQMIHAIHLARVRDGFAERANLVDPGHLSFVGFRNTLLSFAEVLFPMDIRNCSKCHVDVGGTCSASAPCGIGQECVGGTCRNRAWHAPSTRVCLSCHDADDSFGHAALMTYTDPVSGSVIETCEVCHGRGADFSVAKVHDIASPYRPPYPRKKE